MTTGPRAYTEDEVRDRFLAHVNTMARYWTGMDGSNVPEGMETLGRILGFAFSLLSTIDGCGGMPGFKMIPDPHPGDREYHIALCENYYPDDVNIAGCLHELLRAHVPKPKGTSV